MRGYKSLTVYLNLPPQGKMKAKTMSSLMQALSSPDHYLGEDKDKKPASLDRLEVGANPNCTAVVGVAAIVPCRESVP